MANQVTILYHTILSPRVEIPKSVVSIESISSFWRSWLIPLIQSNRYNQLKLPSFADTKPMAALNLPPARK